MIKLHHLRRRWNLPDFSQACAKTETWLRMTGIPYESHPADFVVAPKGKVPYIEHDGQLLGDSTLIVDHLKRSSGRDPDAWLTPVERATALAFRRMIKENLFWVAIQSRYFEEQGWNVYRAVVAEVLAPDAPPEQQERAAADFREYMRVQFRGHGIGRHTPGEVYAIGVADIGAIADYLADKPYFMGDRPSTVDATIYGYISNFLAPPIESPARDYARTRENLVAHTRRMQTQYFPELPVTY